MDRVKVEQGGRPSVHGNARRVQSCMALRLSPAGMDS